MEKLMSRRNDSYYVADRTAQGRSASEVVLQDLGINGGGISADSYDQSLDNKDIPTINHPQNPFFRHGQSTAITSSPHRGTFHRLPGDGRRRGVLSRQWRAGCGQGAC